MIRYLLDILKMKKCWLDDEPALFDGKILLITQLPQVELKGMERSSIGIADASGKPNDDPSNPNK